MDRGLWERVAYQKGVYTGMGLRVELAFYCDIVFAFKLTLPAGTCAWKSVRENVT